MGIGDNKSPFYCGKCKGKFYGSQAEHNKQVH